MDNFNNTRDVVVVSEYKGFVITTINRPNRKNALNHEAYSGLIKAFQYAQEKPEIRGLCIRGVGNTFCSGNDLMDFVNDPPTSENSPVIQFLKILCTFPKPLVAAVQGAAIGIGTTMLLHCDLVYATTSALFQTPFVKLGLCPEAASSCLLPKVIGLHHAMDMLLTGRKIDATTALQWGLITEIFETESFDTTLEQRLDALAALPPEALRVTKSLVRSPFVAQVQEAMEQEIIAFSKRLTSPEALEAMQAFLERRPPDFSRFR